MISAGKGMTFEQFAPGQDFFTSGRTITEHDILAFAGLSGDFNPLHLDEQFALKSPFKQRIPHGLCIMSIATGLIDRLSLLEGTALACLGINWKFFQPVLMGDTVRVVLSVQETKESRKGDRGAVTFLIKVLNQDDKQVEEGGYTLMIRKGNYEG